MDCGADLRFQPGRGRRLTVGLVGAALVGEKVWNETVHRIRRFAGRDGAIIATLFDDVNVHFFRESARQGLDADNLPVMSLSLGEAETPELKERNLIGHIMALNYLHALDTPNSTNGGNSPAISPL